MIVAHETSTHQPLVADICIVGAGPVGIALALECDRLGLSVILLESGGEQPSPQTADLSRAQIADPSRHAAMDVASCRALGGTSRWWGGRCVPYDDIDFAERSFVPDTAWPIAHAAIQPWYEAAAVFFGCPPARFETEPMVFGDVRFDELERWAPVVNMGETHRDALAAAEELRVVLGATVTGLTIGKDGARVDGLRVAHRDGQRTVQANHYVLACGGLETLRLLLAAQRAKPALFGGLEGPLGRGYMGHISGKIADLVLDDPASVAQHDFFRDGPGYARRRFTIGPETQKREALQNIAFWLDNPPFHDPSHRSGVLSAVWIALASPLGRRLLSEGVRLSHVGPAPHRHGAHWRNVLARPFETALTLLRIVKSRLERPRKPGFLVRNKGGRYALHYHAEQRPIPESRVRLGDDRDALGAARLAIDLRYAPEDAVSVIKAHEVLDKALRDAGVGRLEYRAPGEQLIANVLAQASDGFHQIGGAPMAAPGQAGVVDGDGKALDLDNLFLASSCVFPSSGQANPTFLAVALALRLAHHLAAQAGTSKGSFVA